MSSSPQISSQEGHSKTLSSSSSSTSKINTNVGSSASANSVSASASCASACASAYKLPAQEETVFQRETVRISPPLHQKQIPVSTYFPNGHLKAARIIESHAHNQKIRNLPSFDENKFISTEWTYRRFDCVDRECQTDDYRNNFEIHSRSMANDDYEMETVGSNLYPEIHDQSNQRMVDHHPTKSEDDFRNDNGTDCKDRDLDDIEVEIAPLNTDYNECDGVDCITEQPRLNGSAISNDNKIYENKDDYSEKSRPNRPNKNDVEEEKDTCCTSCLLITLNICDCVIL